MVASISEFLAGEPVDDFDLDIRIDDLVPAEPGRNDLMVTPNASCTGCCGCPPTGSSYCCPPTGHWCTTTYCN